MLLGLTPFGRCMLLKPGEALLGITDASDIQADGSGTSAFMPGDATIDIEASCTAETASGDADNFCAGG